MKEVLFGVAGWSYADWKGIVYPPGTGKGFDELAYLASFLDAIEINSSFYRPPSARHAASWVRRTEDRPGFVFTAKLHRGFTHEPNRPFSETEVAGFLDGLAPLREAGKLGALLVQFPWSFRNTEANRRHVARLAAVFADLGPVAEFRHVSWLHEAVLPFFEGLGMGFCNIDQPASSSSIGPSEIATSPVGYVRLHGRNRDAWFSREADRDAKYDYLYTEKELEPWAERIRRIAGKAERTFVIGNNHFKGQAPANILQLRRRITGGTGPVPASLAAAFPFLQPSSSPTEESREEP